RPIATRTWSVTGRKEYASSDGLPNQRRPTRSWRRAIPRPCPSPYRRPRRSHLEALLLGYYTDDGKLIYAGRVSTGMPDKVLTDLKRRLEPLSRAKISSERPAAAFNPPRIASGPCPRALG